MQVRHSRGDLGTGTSAADDAHNDVAVPPIHHGHMFGQLLLHSQSSNVPAGISHSGGNACSPGQITPEAEVALADGW